MTALPISTPRMFWRDPDDDTPLVGGKVFFYMAGTTTPKDTWADYDQIAINTNPVILDADGGADIYGSGAYRIIVRRADDTLAYEIDDVVVGSGGGGGSSINGGEVVTTVDYAVTSADNGKVVIANRPTPITFSLEEAATLGENFAIVIRNIGIGVLTIDPALSELIDGATLKTIDGGSSCLLTCNGSAFRTFFYNIGEGNFSDSLRARLIGVVQTRAAMAALPATGYSSVELTEAGAAGRFNRDGSNLSALVTADPRQGIVVPYASDPTGASGGWVRQFKDDALLRWFRPFADGTTDDTAIINSAVTALAAYGGGALRLDPKTYLASAIVLQSRIELKLVSGSKIDQGSLGTGSTKLVSGIGATTGTAYALTANANMPAQAVTMTAGNAANFAAGDIALIYDDDYVFGPAVAGRNQEIVRVLSVVGTSVNLTRPVTSSYTTARNARLVKLTPLSDCAVSGEGEIAVGPNGGVGVQLELGIDCRVSGDLTIRGSRGGGNLVLRTCTDSQVFNIKSIDGRNITSSGQGYGISLDESCTYCAVYECHFENVRECTYTNRTRFCSFTDNMCISLADTGWNCHGAGSEFNVCQGNTIVACSQGISVGWSGGTRADNNNVVQDNHVSDCTNGIVVSGNSTGPLRTTGNVVKNNVVRRCTGIGIYGFYSDRLMVSGNTVADSTDASFTGYYLNNVRFGVENANVASNFSGANAIGFRVEASQDTMVSHNVVQDIDGAAGISFYIIAGNTDVRVQLNAAIDATSLSVGGAAVNTLNTWN